MLVAESRNSYDPRNPAVPTAKDSRVGRQTKLLDRHPRVFRPGHYSPRTERTSCHWVRRFIFHHVVHHPKEMAEPQISAFLTHLAVKERVSASMQDRALFDTFESRDC
ncbi:MAG: phage integrase N-terminal SAM-like domain-containing protein [Acidobacteria bacterium]|nr:phage integrase N-terminal SAM-like domain-containing protein [Acidobacteriota bacterium]